LLCAGLLCAVVVAQAVAACGRNGISPDDAPGAPVFAPSLIVSETPTPTPAPTPGTAVLVREKFSGGGGTGAGGLAAETNPVWTDNDSGGFEVYGSNGAGARGMKDTYDQDNNAGTAQIKIPGGIEVNSNGPNTLLKATFTLPSLPPNLSYAGGTLRLWVGNRGSPGGSQTIQVFDTLPGTAIMAATAPVLPTGGTPRDWIFNSFNVPFSNANAGDKIEVRFQSSGNGGEGLELADVLLTVQIQ
jgi:hypothetical protein